MAVAPLLPVVRKASGVVPPTAPFSASVPCPPVFRPKALSTGPLRVSVEPLFGAMMVSPASVTGPAIDAAPLDVIAPEPNRPNPLSVIGSAPSATPSTINRALVPTLVPPAVPPSAAALAATKAPALMLVTPV